MEEERLNSIIGSLADAIRSAVTQAAQTAAAQSLQTSTNSSSTQSHKPVFSMGEYKSADGSSVSDYFVRFDWALQLSKISESEYHNYARVHMGAELNTALKILVSPRQPENLTYEEIKSVLSEHFDGKRNVYAESFKFRQVRQESGESLAAFALRLKRAAVFCDYGNALDRMLIEQMIFGLESRAICDDVIAKQPKNFAEAYEIAYAREVTHRATDVVNTNENSVTEPTCKLGYNPIRKRNEPRTKATTMAMGSKCYGCGGQHLRKDCKFRNAKCFACGKTGHITKVCKANTNQTSEQVVSDEDDVVKFINQVGVTKTTGAMAKKIITVRMNGKDVDMELDTGAPCSVMSVRNFNKLGIKAVKKSADRQFSSCTGQKLNCVGKVTVDVMFRRTNRRLNIYVVDDNVDTLCGREWIVHFARDINFTELFDANIKSNYVNDVPSPIEHNMNSISGDTPNLPFSQQIRLQELITRYDEVFSEVAGTFKGPPVSVHLKPGVKPVFARPREIPLALRDAYAKEIETKIAAGFYKKVEFSEWASTTHVVTKKNGGIRITGNYKPTINPQMIVDEHPIPKAEDIFNKMKGATVFAHLDVTDAYSHLVVDEEFAHVLTLNTPTHGLIRPTRAVYGAANIPAVWQRTMESALQDITNVLNFFDDILIYARDMEELLNVLEVTLKRLQELGFKLNKSKCIFASSSIEFLGHKIDAQGIHKSNRHIEAILQSSKPKSIEDIQLFLGKASYYSNFIPDLSTLERPLRNIIKNGKFSWTKEADAAYDKIKQILISPQVLIPYDPDLPLLLATDASKTGLGAVLSHRLPNNQERPIAYASRTMTATEQKYPQIDKEALAIVWAVQRFFKYLYARHWTLITDHKPLAQILQPNKSLPTLCISRMANYADFLSNFTFDVVHKHSKDNANADYLSRISNKNPSPNRINGVNAAQIPTDENDEFDQFILKQINQLPLTASRVAQETKKDDHLGKIVQLLESGKCLASYGYKSPEINYKLSSGCLTFEHRIVIPPKFRSNVLNELHGSHLGVVKMKGIARSFIYWPGVDKDIEKVAKECEQCANNARNPTKFKDHHWEYPKSPWERVHIDYAGPIDGMMILIITDAYSKWLEVKVTKYITAAATISLLDEVFATYGVPLMVVTDNGTNFSSVEFNEFLKAVGVKYHKYTAPYHPSTNGQAERYVQTVKNALKAMCTTQKTLRKNLNEFLRHYRNAPHYTTGQSPAQLFLGRQLRTRLDLLIPEDTAVKISSEQYLKSNGEYRQFQNKELVYFMSCNPRLPKWLKGVITKRLGDIHYEINYEGKCYKRHVDQIRGSGKEKIEIQENSNAHREGVSDIDVRPSTSQQALRETTNSHNASYVTADEDRLLEHTSSKEEQNSRIVSDESSTTQFRGFSPPSFRDLEGRSTSTPHPRSTEQGDLRRSSRTRRPRVLFSP